MCLRAITPGEVALRANLRFEEGDALAEMVDIQKQSQIFHPSKSLQEAYRLLNIGPRDPLERRHFFRFLENLKTVPSDIPGMYGYERIIKARQENLEGPKPLPMFSKTHPDADNCVRVTTGSPLTRPVVDHVIISVPLIPA